MDEADVPALQSRFETVYQQLYERLGPPVAIEILNWRVVSAGPQPDVQLQIDSGPGAAATVADAQKARRPAYFPEAGGFTATPVYDRYRLRPGMTFTGPAIVEERESTAIIGPQARCHIDEQHNLIVALAKAGNRTTTGGS